MKSPHFCSAEEFLSIMVFTRTSRKFSWSFFENCLWNSLQQIQFSGIQEEIFWEISFSGVISNVFVKESLVELFVGYWKQLPFVLKFAFLTVVLDWIPMFFAWDSWTKRLLRAAVNSIIWMNYGRRLGSETSGQI